MWIDSRGWRSQSNSNRSWIIAAASWHPISNTSILHPCLVGLTVVAAAGTPNFSNGALIRRSVELLLEYRLGVNCLKLCSEVRQALCAAVGSTPSIVHGVPVVLDFVSGATPIKASRSAELQQLKLR